MNLETRVLVTSWAGFLGSQICGSDCFEQDVRSASVNPINPYGASKLMRHWDRGGIDRRQGTRL
jgi:hypothetical protein